MKKSLLIIIFLPFLMVSCKGKKDNGNEEKVEINAEINSIDKTRESLDSITIPEFAIQMELSEKAKNKLSTNKESVIVQAYFSGIPKDTLSEDYEKWGKVHIGEHKIELWNSRIASFKGIKLSKEVFDGLSDKNFEVLINVFSGRHSIASNLLDCGIIQESIDSIKGKTHLIKGKLLFGE